MRYQLKLRVYTREVMLINSTVFAHCTFNKVYYKQVFSFASLFLRVFHAFRSICSVVIILLELNKIKNCRQKEMEFSNFRPILVFKITRDIK